MIRASRLLLPYRVGPARLHYLVAWLLLVPLTVGYSTLGLVASFLPPHGRAAHVLARSWARVLLRIAGVRLRVVGGESAPHACMYVCNHQSALDIPAVMASLPGQLRFLAKASLFRIPFMGWFMTRMGYVPVDRADPRRAVRVLRRARHAGAGGTAILVFPEGTRTPEGVLGEFKRGSFHVARDAGLPIVPVALVNAGRLMPPGGWRVEPGVIEIRIGEPILPAEREHARALAERVRAALAVLGGWDATPPTPPRVRATPSSSPTRPPD